MSRSKYSIRSCLLALIVSFGLGISWPSYSWASVYTFTFFENLSFTENSYVTGSFAIPVADFSTALPNTQFSVLTNDITALSMTQDSQSFGLLDILLGYNLIFNMNGSNVPQVYYESAGWLVTSPNGCNPNTTTCTGGIQPGNLGLVDVIIPAGETQIYGDWVTTTASIATPLPATWTMMLIGFVGFGFLAYRGKKNTATALAA